MQDDLNKALEVLRRGGLILYPTDTVWGIGCDATDSAAVRRVFDLKRRADGKALICLLASPAMLDRYASGVPEVAYELLDVAVDPLTLIVDGACVPPLAPELPAPDGSVAFRITAEPFSAALCRALRKPLVSTSANVSGSPTPLTFGEISQEIFDGVDYVCLTGRNRQPARPSQIVKLTASGCVTVIRQ